VGIRNAAHKGGGQTQPVQPPAFQTQDKQATGKRASTSRIDRIVKR
jgi:hypothetical protein